MLLELRLGSFHSLLKPFSTASSRRRRRAIVEVGFYVNFPNVPVGAWPLDGPRAGRGSTNEGRKTGRTRYVHAAQRGPRRPGTMPGIFARIRKVTFYDINTVGDLVWLSPSPPAS
jgi:hypothetical protein